MAKADLPPTTVHTDQNNAWSTGTQDFESAGVTRPFRRLAFASFPATCTANREFLERSDPATAGQVLYACNSGGTGWDLIGDGSGGGNHNLLSATHPDTAAASVVRGDMITGQGATPSWQRLALGAADRVLFSNGTDATWAQVSDAALANNYSGVGSCAANNFATATNDNAAPTCAQPASSNLSDGTSLVKNNATNTYSGTVTQDFGASTITLVAPKKADPGTPTTGEFWINGASLKYRDNQGTPATQTVEIQTNKNAASGYAGLTASTKLVASQGQEVWALNDLSDVSITTPATAQTVRYNGTSWVNAALACADVTNCPALVAAGTAGVGPSKAGTATAAARSDHDHRSIHALTWFFPGTPSTGVQNMTLVFPESAVNLSILDMRVTVNTTSASSSTFNIQRCTASCTGTSPTFANIYSANLTLGANTRTASKGSAPDQNVSGLAAGDQFKANLMTIGSGLADATATITYKYDTTN